MICYDYLLTLDQEARFMWRRSSRRSGAALLYYTVRYPGLLGAAAAIYTSVLAPPISGAPSKAYVYTIPVGPFSLNPL
ncbi:hypothetical protein C8Q77DRAFT_1131652 [Trametes polyzona]|nr:hypothetical protein C8Q77DRAFT_1131652 [Trametes polyzona]